MLVYYISDINISVMTFRSIISLNDLQVAIHSNFSNVQVTRVTRKQILQYVAVYPIFVCYINCSPTDLD